MSSVGRGRRRSRGRSRPAAEGLEDRSVGTDPGDEAVYQQDVFAENDGSSIPGPDRAKRLYLEPRRAG